MHSVYLNVLPREHQIIKIVAVKILDYIKHVFPRTRTGSFDVFKTNIRTNMEYTSRTVYTSRSWTSPPLSTRLLNASIRRLSLPPPAGAAETTTELVLAETTATRNGTSESTNGGGVRVPPVITGPVRDRRKTSNCAAAPPVKTLGVGGRGVTRAGRLGLEDMKTLGEPTATLTTIVDEEEECGQG